MSLVLPLPYTLILGSFFIQEKQQNKEIWSFFFFLMFLSLVGFAVWGFEKTIWKMELPRTFSLGHRAYIVSGAPQLTKEKKRHLRCFFDYGV